MNDQNTTTHPEANTEDLTPPTLPLDALGPILRPLVMTIAKVAGVPPELPLASALSVASGATHRLTIKLPRERREPLSVEITGAECPRVRQTIGEPLLAHERRMVDAWERNRPVFETSLAAMQRQDRDRKRLGYAEMYTAQIMQIRTSLDEGPPCLREEPPPGSEPLPLTALGIHDCPNYDDDALDQLALSRWGEALRMLYSAQWLRAIEYAPLEIDAAAAGVLNSCRNPALAARLAGVLWWLESGQGPDEGEGSRPWPLPPLGRDPITRAVALADYFDACADMAPDDVLTDMGNTNRVLAVVQASSGGRISLSRITHGLKNSPLRSADIRAALELMELRGLVTITRKQSLGRPCTVITATAQR